MRLTIEPTTPYIISPSVPLHIVLVGCGGTGSHVAQSLARIAVHTRLQRDQLRLTFVDGDVVEPTNVGRQLFGPDDIGRNKAQVLAARFNHLFGLSIEALPAMATAPNLSALGKARLPITRGGFTQRAGPGMGILVGAVDGAPGRRAMADALTTPAYTLWLDSGNHAQSGQVCVGSEIDPLALEGAVMAGFCARLPAPVLLYPDLLRSAPARPRTDCAAAVEDNVQALMVNQAMAAVVGQYLAQIIIHRRLTVFETVIDLTTLSMRSTPITARTIRAVQEQHSRGMEAAA